MDAPAMGGKALPRPLEGLGPPLSIISEMPSTMAGVPGPYGPAQDPSPFYPPSYPSYPSTYPPTYGAYPFSMVPRRRLTSRQIAGLALGVVGIILVAVSILGTWWSASVSGSFSGTSLSVQEDFGLFGFSARAMGFGASMGYDLMPQVGQVFLITALFLLGGIVLSAVSLALGFVRGGSGLRTAGLLTGVIAGVLVAFAPIYLMVTLPGVGNPGQSLSSGFTITGDFRQFWGSGTITYTGLTMQMTWGAGWAWYLAFAAAAFVLIGGALMALGRPQGQPVPFAPYAPFPAPIQQMGSAQSGGTVPGPESPEPFSPGSPPPSGESAPPSDSPPE